MFRLKFRFTSRVALLICATICVGCSLICVSTGNVVVLVLASFVAGFFRMWGTFECNSSIQLWLTPKRDMAVFFLLYFFNGKCLYSIFGTYDSACCNLD